MFIKTFYQNKPFFISESKGMLKTPEFDASYDPVVTESKGMLKSTDFDAN